MPQLVEEGVVRITERDLPSFLDMLRYDRCEVTKWDHLESQPGRPERYDVYLRSRVNGRLEGGRWSSFGLPLRDVQTRRF